jgi:hypothetical protein
MSHQPVCGAFGNSTAPEIILRCVGNLIVVGALPFRLGQTGAPWWGLPIYAVLAGLMMTLAEDIHFARAIFLRRDVRGYAQVRVALIAALGTVPFAAGMGFVA